jgi:hypothetical protein
MPDGGRPQVAGHGARLDDRPTTPAQDRDRGGYTPFCKRHG